MISGEGSFGVTTRTYNLRESETGLKFWAWVAEDDGSFLEDQTFPTEQAARDWMAARGKGHSLKIETKT